NMPTFQLTLTGQGSPWVAMGAGARASVAAKAEDAALPRKYQEGGLWLDMERAACDIKKRTYNHNTEHFDWTSSTPARQYCKARFQHPTFHVYMFAWRNT
ncbi:hypothetical protein GOP47_0002277, partial [Adiantum capillus-veneris]